MRKVSRREFPDRPVVGVGAVVIRDGKILLVKRGIEPSKGLWAIPGGSLELGETLQQAAEREILEETGVTIRAREPIYAFDFFERTDSGRVRFHFVIVDVAADYISGEAKGNDDALDARWLAPGDLGHLPVSQNTIKLLKVIGFI
ncbi:MAG: NUDIX hydrolase [Syntrophus sp. (in: bacteria)]|nr:NUDIX hydrolase [Syntrophus sp. (in: bacteria)]